jgi:hypothetical protein
MRRAGRLEARQERMRARQERRDIRQDARLDRRDERRDRRPQDGIMGAIRERVSDRIRDGRDEGYIEEYYPEDDYYAEDEYQYEEDFYDEHGYYPDEEGEYDQGELDGSLEDDIEYEDEGDYIGEEMGYAFDGEPATVSPNVKSVTDKIAWNEAAMSKLRIQRAKALGSNRPVQGIDKAMNTHVLRLRELKDVLSQYSNLDGGFTMAREGRQGVIFQRGLPQEGGDKEKSRRKLEIVTSMNSSFDGIRESLPTLVAENLNPKFGTQRIVIPSEENSNVDGMGINTTDTGLIGLKDIGDYDAPIVEVKLGADGKKTKSGGINWKGVALGGLVAVGIVVVLRKTKVI